MVGWEKGTEMLDGGGGYANRAVDELPGLAGAELSILMYRIPQVEYIRATPGVGGWVGGERVSLIPPIYGNSSSLRSFRSVSVQFTLPKYFYILHNDLKKTLSRYSDSRTYTNCKHQHPAMAPARQA